MKDSKPTITSFLVVKNAGRAVEFYSAAFEAKELVRHESPDGRLTSKIAIANGEVWVGDEEPEFDNVSPATLGGSGMRMVLTIADPDAVFARALQAGATQICPVTTEAHWKIGKLRDPFGHIWEIGHPLEEEND